MFKGIAILCFSAFSIVASAADSAAIGGPPSISPAFATEGQPCVGVGTQAINTAGLPLSCQSGVWKGGIKPTPDTAVLVFLESYGGIVRYCPSGYAATAATAIGIPNGFPACVTTVFNDSATSKSGTQMSGCTLDSGNTYFYHQLVCSKFQ